MTYQWQQAQPKGKKRMSTARLMSCHAHNRPVISPSFQVKGVKFTSRIDSTWSELDIAMRTISPHLTFSKQHIMKPIYLRPIDINKTKFLWHLIDLIMKGCYERTGCTLQSLTLLICPRLKTTIQTGNVSIPMLEKQPEVGAGARACRASKHQQSWYMNPGSRPPDLCS